ncbi:hypothetical protein Emed_003763 [Eimeria media]
MWVEDEVCSILQQQLLLLLQLAKPRQITALKHLLTRTGDRNTNPLRKAPDKMPRNEAHESGEERQAPLSDPEIDEGEPEEEAAENDENYDYLQATRRLEGDELQAEEEGERLIDDQEDDGFVFGMKDDAREAAAFLAAGLDPDAEDLNLIDDEDLQLNEAAEARARRAAERHLRARDRLRQSGDKKDIWQKLFEDDEDEAAEMERLLQRVQERRRHLSRAAADGDVVNLRDLQQAKSLLADSNPRQVAFGPEHQQAVDTLFRCRDASSNHPVSLLSLTVSPFRYFLYHFSLSAFTSQSLISHQEGEDGQQQQQQQEETTGGAYYLDKIQQLILVSRQLTRGASWLTSGIFSLSPSNSSIGLNSIPHPLCRSAAAAEAAAIAADIAASSSSRYSSCSSSYSSSNSRNSSSYSNCSSSSSYSSCCSSNSSNNISYRSSSISSSSSSSRTPWLCTINSNSSKSSSSSTAHSLCLSLSLSLFVSFGVVTRRSSVLPRVRLVYLRCALCLHSVSDAPLQVVEGQKKEAPSQCPPGRPPRQRELLLTGETVDSAKPGDAVEVLGVYRTKLDVALNIKTGFPVLGTEILVNNITTKKEEMISELTDDDIREIKQLSRHPNIRERIIASIAPTLCASKQVKAAVAYALFGGVPKGRDIAAAAGTQQANPAAAAAAAAVAEDGKATAGQHVIRGDINVLLLGDPGLGKSQALQYVARTFPRSVLTTGKGASACGLTAGVRRDPYSGEWSLEGGALVLADEGICLIDEFDKMTEGDRVSIHEAMEQQSISISKAGIVTTLRARCSVIAAANPKFGRYIPSYTFKENVDLSDPILSRFDLICVLRDVPDADEDFSVADYVLGNHQLHHPNILSLHAEPQKRIAELESRLHATEAHEPINQQLLQKYILYARSHCHPILDPSLPSLSAKLSSFYAKLRKRAAASGGLPLTLRHVESLLRISEANAKMRLSPTVSLMDVEFAIAAVLSSFLSAQKFAVQQRLSKEFARYTALATGGWATLAALLRRLLQQRLQRATLRQREAEGDEETTTLYHQRQIEQARRADFHDFLKLASQHKFTAYQVESWMASNSFKAHFTVIEEDNCKVLVSNNWLRDIELLLLMRVQQQQQQQQQTLRSLLQQQQELLLLWDMQRNPLLLLQQRQQQLLMLQQQQLLLLPLC